MIGRLAHLLRMQAPVVDNRGLLYLSGATVPTDDSDGYQTGCIFQHTDGGDDTALYVNEGSVTACDFNPVTVGAAGEMSQIEFNDDLTGPLISIDTTDPTGASYETPFIITGTYSSTCALALQLSITNQRPVSFLFDDGGSVLGSGNYRAVLSRVMLCSTQTGQVAIRAIRGQVKVADGLALNIGASEFNSINGVEGYMELAGATGRTVGANTRVAALHSLTEIRQDITLTAGGKVCGLLVELAQTTAKTVDGIGSAAIAVDRVDSDHADVQADWDTGLVFGDSSVTTGVKIGVCTSGIVLTGVTGRAIDIATSGVFRMGIEGTGVSVNNTYPYGLEIHTKTTTDFAQPATGVSAGIYSRYEHSFDQVTATGHAAVFAKLRVKKDLVDGVHAASYNYVEVSGGANTDIGGTATTQTTAGMFSIETDTGFILSDGLLSGIIVDSSIHVTGTFSGTISGVRIQKSGTGKAWPTGIQIVASATETGIAIGTCATAAVHILGDQAIGILFDVDASATDGLKMSVDTSMTLTEGIEISGAGTVTTGITLAMDLSTTGILISAAACATGISITAGSLTDGIKVSGATPVDGVEVSSVCSGAALHVSGAPATGLSISAACTTAGINIVGGTAAGHAILVGTSSTGVQVDGTPDYAVEFYADIPTGAQSLGNVGAFNCRTTIKAASDITSGSHTVASYHRLEIEGGSTDLGYGWYNAILGYLKNPSGSVDATQSAIGAILGLVNVGADWDAQSEAINAAVVAGTYSPNTADIRKYYGFYVWKGGTLAFTHGMYVEAASCTVGIGIGGCTNLLSLPIAGTAPVVASATAANQAAEGSVSILVNGVEKFLQYFAASS